MFAASFKVVVVGDSLEGLKSEFVSHLGPDSSRNLGIDFVVTKTTVNKEDYQLKVWDTAGQERFRTISAGYLRGANLAVLAYSVHDHKSFENVRNWLENIRKTDANIPCMLVGIRSGVGSIEVDKKEAQELSDALGCIGFSECSIRSPHDAMKFATEYLVAKKPVTAIKPAAEVKSKTAAIDEKRPSMRSNNLSSSVSNSNGSSNKSNNNVSFFSRVSSFFTKQQAQTSAPSIATMPAATPTVLNDSIQSKNVLGAPANGQQLYPVLENPTRMPQATPVVLNPIGLANSNSNLAVPAQSNDYAPSAPPFSPEELAELEATGYWHQQNQDLRQLSSISPPKDKLTEMATNQAPQNPELSEHLLEERIRNLKAGVRMFGKGNDELSNKRVNTSTEQEPVAPVRIAVPMSGM